jgi:hypothetical protein
MSPFNTRETEIVVISLRNVIFNSMLFVESPPPYADAVLVIVIVVIVL